MDENSIFITAEESGERIDALLACSVEGLSRSAIQKLVLEGMVLRNGVPLKKNDRSVAGERYEILLPAPADVPLIAQDLPLNIVYEDRDLLVINKERGMVVHPAPGHPDGTLVNALLYHCGDELSGIGGEKRPGIIHRIDKDTSGLIIVAKNDFSHHKLSEQLSDHTLYREYVAVAHGSFREDTGTVDAPIGRHRTDRKRMAVTDLNSRPAVTHWQVLTRYRDFTYIQCRLETGRTHQIRVHMSYLGHPLLGDATYGARSPEKGLAGQCLHAKALHFIHPVTGEEIRLTTELPEYFTSVLFRLGTPLE